jgi:hypothetical protein
MVEHDDRLGELEDVDVADIARGWRRDCRGRFGLPLTTSVPT